MGQRGVRRTVFVKRRTLSTVPLSLRLCFVPSIRAHLVELQRRSQLLWLEDKRLTEGLDIACLRLAIAFSLELSLLALHLLLVIALPETFLEKGRYGIGDALELLVALRLCGLEATCNMAPDERHRYSV